MVERRPFTKTNLVSLKPIHQESSMNNGGPRIITGIGYPALAEKVATLCDTELVQVNTNPFTNGELYSLVKDHVRGADVFLVDSLHTRGSASTIEQAEFTLDCIRHSAGRLSGVFPFLAYGKQDRRTQPRESHSAKVIARRLSTSGLHRAMLFDLHNSATAGFFDIPIDLVYLMRLLIEEFQSRHLSNVVIGGPDIGSGKRVYAVARILGISDVALVFKVHKEDKSLDLSLSQVLGNVANREVWLFDDMIQGGKTITIAATLLKHHGAKRVTAAAVHPDFVPAVDDQPSTVERLTNCEALDEVIVVGTIPHPDKSSWPTKIKMLPPEQMIADCIKLLHQDESLSSMFLKY